MSGSYPTSIRVVRFLIHETGTYNSQFSRPYVSNMNASAYHQILDNVAQSPTINPSVFSGLSNQIVTPSSTYEGVLNIPNGWGTRRFKFMLELEVGFKTGGSIREIVTGWSETPAESVSLYGTLDPNTVFRVNNTLHVRQQTMPTPMGAQTFSSISDCSHVLCNHDWNGIHDTAQKRLMRPADIFSRMLTSGLEHELSRDGSYDASTSLMGVATKSRRSNGIASNFISDIVKTYTDASAQLGVGVDVYGTADTIGSAQNYSRENSASRDPFLDTMASLKAVTVTDTFTLKELSRLDPNADANTVYVKMGPLDMSRAHQANQTQHWGGSDLHTHIASILANSVPAAMMQFLLMETAFVITNMDISGQLEARMAHIRGFSDNIDLSQYAKGFMAKLEHEIVGDIIRSYPIGLGIQMRVDLMGETWITVKIDHEEVDYVVPSFADGLLTPVMTTKEDTGRQLAVDFKCLLDNIVDYRNHSLSGASSVIMPGQALPPRDKGILVESGLI